MVSKILCVIPARINSTRLPKKPLAIIGNKPMIQWVYEAACTCSAFNKVIVATDSLEIKELIDNLGGHAELSPEELSTGTDRVAYVAQKFPEYQVVVNLQGDQPFMRREMLLSLLSPYINGLMPAMATLACPLNFSEDYHDPNIVKLLYNKMNYAIYFSRAPIPFFRNQIIKNLPIAMHIGVYAFTREFLLEFTKLEQTALEQVELLEQLRALEYGIDIYVSHINERIIEVNSADDLTAARNYIDKILS